MGKGDQKSKKGKRFSGSHGVSRPKKSKKNKNKTPSGSTKEVKKKSPEKAEA